MRKVDALPVPTAVAAPPDAGSATSSDEEVGVAGIAGQAGDAAAVRGELDLPGVSAEVEPCNPRAGGGDHGRHVGRVKITSRLSRS